MKPIQKLDKPGQSTESVLIIGKINELTDAFNQAEEPEEHSDLYKKIQKLVAVANKAKEPEKKTYPDIIDEIYNEMKEASITRDTTKWNELFEKLKTKLETQQTIQDLLDFEEENQAEPPENIHKGIIDTRKVGIRDKCSKILDIIRDK